VLRITALFFLMPSSARSWTWLMIWSLGRLLAEEESGEGVMMISPGASRIIRERRPQPRCAILVPFDKRLAERDQTTCGVRRSNGRRGMRDTLGKTFVDARAPGRLRSRTTGGLTPRRRLALERYHLPAPTGLAMARGRRVFQAGLDAAEERRLGAQMVNYAGAELIQMAAIRTGATASVRAAQFSVHPSHTERFIKMAAHDHHPRLWPEACRMGGAQ
jgi:hypothetical protein